MPLLDDCTGNNVRVTVGLEISPTEGSQGPRNAKLLKSEKEAKPPEPRVKFVVSRLKGSGK